MAIIIRVGGRPGQLENRRAGSGFDTVESFEHFGKAGTVGEFSFLRQPLPQLMRVDGGSNCDAKDGEAEDSNADNGKADEAEHGKADDGKADVGKANDDEDGKADDGGSNDGKADDGEADDQTTEDGRTDDGN